MSTVSNGVHYNVLCNECLRLSSDRAGILDSCQVDPSELVAHLAARHGCAHRLYAATTGGPGTTRQVLLGNEHFIMSLAKALKRHKNNRSLLLDRIELIMIYCR
jgi:hypothetical protein